MSTLDSFARDYYAAVDRRDYGALAIKLDEDCEFAAPGFEGRGSEVVMGFAAPFLAAFPDIRHRIVTTVEAGDTVAIEVEVTGTHTQPLAGPGGELPPTGRSIRFAAAILWRVIDGRITSYRVYFDSASLMAQLETSGPSQQGAAPGGVERAPGT